MSPSAANAAGIRLSRETIARKAASFFIGTSPSRLSIVYVWPSAHRSRKVTAERLCTHALINKQALCQRVQRPLLSSNLLEYNEIGEAVGGSKRRCAKSVTPAGRRPANILALPQPVLDDRPGEDCQLYGMPLSSGERPRKI